MPSRVIELREEQVLRVPRQQLADAELLEMSKSKKFEIDQAGFLNGQTYGLRSLGWIGHIPIGTDLLVRVLPKVSIANLFGMLEVVYNLRSFKILEGETDIERIEQLYERIVSILARRVLDRARKGLYRSYVGLEEALPYVRGRLDPLSTILNVKQGIAKIPCRYEEQTADIEENRILLWTLRQVRRQTLAHQRVRQELDAARRALDGTITLERCGAASCVARLYNRLNDDYRAMHGLCRFVLEQSGPGLKDGDRTFVPFVLNMPNLFEAYVAEWLRQNPPPGLRVQSQYSTVVDSDLGLTIRVDIVLCDETSGQTVAVLDTKYKTGEQPSEADIHQVAFYARELGADRAMLVYPSPSVRQFSIRHGAQMKVESILFDVSVPLDQAGSAFRKELQARIRNI